MIDSVDEDLKVISVDVKDLRWPTSLGGHGSDAMVSSTFLENKLPFPSKLSKIDDFCTKSLDSIFKIVIFDQNDQLCATS